jgi:pyruvate/2-oxoglutarate dehydrogenase complex dihydrolipoamide dehydrogenase (E3) component
LIGFHGFGAVIEDLVPFMQFAIQEQWPLSRLATMIAPHPSYGEILKLAIDKTQ